MVATITRVQSRKANHGENSATKPDTRPVTQTPTHPSLEAHISTSIYFSFSALPQERVRRWSLTKPSKKRRGDRRGPRGWRAGSRIGSMTSTEAPGVLRSARGGPRKLLLRSLPRTLSTAPLAVARSAAGPSPPP